MIIDFQQRKMLKNNDVHKSIEYRPDIDGLRGISILLVVVAHVFRLQAGDVGVDIFFVISGYLITSILLKQHKKGTYSLKNFYIRRVKRIFPVLFLSVAVFFLITFVYFRSYLKYTAEHIVASLLMSMNLWLIAYAYAPRPQFIQYNLLGPNWTLGIQQQFYLIWPLILALIFHKQAYRRKAIVLMSIIVSLIMLVLFRSYSRQIPFGRFLCPTRCWQLLCGCMLALCQFQNCDEDRPTTVKQNQLYQLVQSSSSQINIAETNTDWKDPIQLTYIIINLGIIVFVFQNKNTEFQQLFYVLWAVMLIKFKNFCFNKLILASKFLVFVGKISYSLYIWHQGVITLKRYDSPYLSLLVAVIGIAFYPLQNKIRISKHPYIVHAILAFGFFILILGIITLIV